jgi:hypothetical protein
VYLHSANDCGTFTGTQGPSSAASTGFTVGYDTDNNVWNTRYSYSPERIASLDDTLYTFQNGIMYVHDDTANRSTYYGVGYGSTVEVISNNNPSMVKAYESLSLEGTSAWAATATNTDQSTSILSTDFEERELKLVRLHSTRQERQHRNCYHHIAKRKL